MTEASSLFSYFQLQATSWSSIKTALRHQQNRDHFTSLAIHLSAQNLASDVRYLMSCIANKYSNWRSSRREVNRYSTRKSCGGERH